jgi:hypothetical protein
LFDRFIDGIGENYPREAGYESSDQNVNPYLLCRLFDLSDADLLAASEEESSLIDLNGEETRKEDQEGSEDLYCDEHPDSNQSRPYFHSRINPLYP